MIRLAFQTRRPAPCPEAYATIMLSAHQSVQGPVLRQYRDGRVKIDSGQGPLIGHPLGQAPDPQPIWTPLFAGMM